MLTKLAKAFSLLRQEVTALKGDVQRIEKVRQVVQHGKDGVSPDPDEIVSAVLEKIPTPKDGISPDPQTVAEVAAKLIPEPKPGRDAVPPSVRDVADVVLAKIEKPKDGVSPDPKAIAEAAAKLLPVPKDGVSPTAEEVAKKMPNPQRGKTGAPGKNGVSVTDVQLNNNELFVFLDGKKKKAGTIKVPAASAPFNPGNAGGGGSARGKAPDINTPENLIIVNNLTIIKTAPETRITFKANTEYRFSSLTVIESSFEADLEDGAVLTGPSQLTESYRYTGTGTAFNSDGVRFEFRNFGYSVPNGTVFDVLNALPVVLNFTRCFECESIGTISGVGGTTALNLFDSVFLDVKTSGLKTPGNFLLISIREVFMVTTSAGVTLIDWSNSTLNDLEITNLEALAPSGSFVLDGDAGSVNINAGRVATIRDSSLSTIALGNALGPGLSPDDAGYQYSNSIVIDSKVIGHCYIAPGDEQTTPISSGVEVPVAGAFTEGGEASQTSCASNGFITTNNRIEKRGTISVDLDIDKNGGGQDDYIFRLKKIPIDTGAPEDVDGAFSTITLSGGGSDAITISGPVRFKEGDQFYTSVIGSTNDDIEAFTSGLKVTE